MDGVLQEFALRAPEWAGQIRNVVIGATVLTGLMNCFFGYRLFRLFFACLGFALGAAGGGYMGYIYGGSIWALVGGLTGGIFGAMVLFAMYMIGVFLAGGMAAAFLAAVVLAGAGISVPTLLLVVPLVLGGIVAIVVHKLVIIVASSFGGAMSVVYGVAMLTGEVIDPLAVMWQTTKVKSIIWQDPGTWAAWAALGVAGVFVQYRFTANKDGNTAGSPPSESDE